jgi:uncharacterized protein
MRQLTIEREVTPHGGRYAGRIDDGADEIELTYVSANKGRVIADHTYTPPAMRGRGYASKLVERLVSDARSEGFKIVPRCPYVAAQFDLHPAWGDVKAG